ncbi:reverse transcriptase [Caerostris darwini]|uniref:Reverse transcriptase n=1 Tax=Caerostris darwini TaxID=1538125 RepID=A0AAV4U7M3_9ARAC|nr:reverse transcriptase [Caerostris darwini]
MGIPDDEKADIMPKNGAEFNQTEFPLTLRTECNYIIATIDNLTSKNLKDLSGNKRWKCRTTGARILMHLKRAETVARYRLTTGHDYLQAHLHLIGLVSDRIYPLCLIGDQMWNCTDLIDVPEDITARYCEAGRRMA